jgi:DNA-binding NtrC family response regulator
MRVLVVDDEIDFLETLVNRLRLRSIHAEGVATGEAALELIKDKPFDVVILDVKFPGGKGGIEIFREMRKLVPLTEVIFLTGHASVETSAEGMRLGAFDYLLKPVKLEELLPKLTAAFERKRKQEEKTRRARARKTWRVSGQMSDHGKKE